MLAERISNSISQEVGKIFEMVLECTCDMIKGDFQSYPDHRVKLYDLLKVLGGVFLRPYARRSMPTASRPSSSSLRLRLGHSRAPELDD